MTFIIVSCLNYSRLYYQMDIKTVLNRTFLHIAVIVIATFFLHMEVFEFFFIRDDFALLYELQNGLTFSYPYHLLPLIYKPVFLIAGIEPFLYYFAGVLSVVVFAIVIYFFGKLIFGKKNIALILAIVAAASPIGINSNQQAIVFLYNYLATTALLLTMITLNFFIKSKKIYYYVASIFIFILTLEFFPSRAFYYFIILFLFDFLIAKVIKESLLTSIKRNAIYFLLTIEYFLIRAPYFNQSANNRQITENKLWEHASNLQTYFKAFVGLLNTFFGGVLTLITPESSLDSSRYLLLFIIIFGLIVAFVILSRIKDKSSNYKMLFLFSLLWIYVNNLGIAVINQPGVPAVYSRTLTFILPAYALLIVCLFEIIRNHLKKKYFAVIILSLIVTINIYSMQKVYRELNEQRSQYAYDFYSTLLKIQPRLPENAIIYLDTPTDLYEAYQLTDIYRVGYYGGQTSFAVAYGINHDKLKLATEPNELESLIKNNEDIEKIYAFSYKEYKLLNITEKVRSELREKLQSN